MGRSTEAITAAQVAIKLAPLDLLPWINLGWCLLSVGQFEQALEAFNQANEICGTAPTVKLFLAMLALIGGDAERALTINLEQPVEMWRLQVLAMAHHTLGHTEKSDSALHAILAKPSGEFAQSAAQVYGWRGEADRGFESLERARHLHSAILWQLKISSPRRLRHDARFKALLRSINLPE